MSKFLIYCAVYVFLERDGCLYLMRRANTGHRDGMYGLPSGHVEEGETLIAAMQRELLEETGLAVPGEDLILRHAMYRRCDDRTYTDYYYVCSTCVEEPRIMEHEKCDDACWVSVHDLPKEMIPEVRYAWESIQKGQPFSDIRVNALRVVEE